MAQPQRSSTSPGAGSTSAAPGNPLAATRPAEDVEAILEARLAEARADLAALQVRGPEGGLGGPPGSTPDEVSRRRSLLEFQILALEQHLADARELEYTRRQQAELEREVAAWEGFAQPPPYSILLADGLHDEVRAAGLALANAESALVSLVSMVDDARRALRDSEERTRLLDEQLEGVADAAGSTRLVWLRDLARVQNRLETARVASLESARRLGELRAGLSRGRLELLQRQLRVAEAGARFTLADLEKIVSGLESERRDLESQMTQAQEEQQGCRAALEAARRELAQAQAGAPGAPTGPDALRRLAERVQLRQAELDTAIALSDTLRVRLAGALLNRTMWEHRFEIQPGSSFEKLRAAQRELGDFGRRLALWRDFYDTRLKLVARQLQPYEDRLRDANLEADSIELARQYTETLRRRERGLRRGYEAIERSEQLAERWRESLETGVRQLPLTGRLRNLSSGVGSFFRRLWSFELFAAEDTIVVDGQPVTGRRSVTLGKIAMALVILVAGYLASGPLAHLVARLVERRFKVEAQFTDLVRRWVRVVFVLGLIVFSLVSVKIPLTIFAFAGGALAIGLGFGMQNLLKNFISGLLILAERPFRVGDVIQVGGQTGTVSTVGIRSCVLRLWDNTEVLIPNSALLENPVTNWTYSDRVVRFSLEVGVAYGSDTRRVSQLLADAADRHGLVQKQPAPMVLFTRFGDSALSFELRYWLEVPKTNAGQVASDLRHMIAGAFAESGMVMAFPQRDVHLELARPLPVRLVPPAEPAPLPAADPEKRLPANPSTPSV